MSNIVVLADAREGKIKKPTLEAVGAAKELAGKSGGSVVAVVVGHQLDAAKQDLANSGASKVVAVDAETFAQYSGDGFARAILEQLEGLSPAAILMPHTAMGRDLMPRIAAKMSPSMVSVRRTVGTTGGSGSYFRSKRSMS